MTAILLLLLAASAFLFWLSNRAAAERAAIYGRQACERANVQWLDQSVHQTKLRLRRDNSGRLRWERRFRFEYSANGQDRHAGLIILLGGTLSGLAGPMPAAAQAIH